jgi:threonine dehydratase
MFGSEKITGILNFYEITDQYSAMDHIPTLKDIHHAHQRIKPFIHRTPVLTSELINNRAKCSIFFKCENFQKVGAFKMRGAANAVLSLPATRISRGVATHSSGNHAQALAKAAVSMGTKAYIVMPESAPQVKVNAVKAYGAEIFFCNSSQQAREQTLRTVLKETGATFIHPYDDYHIIAGQATAAAELIDEVEGLDIVIAPVGGGGLLSGTCLSATYLQPKAIIYGAEPSGADDAKRSLDSGMIHPSIEPNTIADGLLTSLSERTFGIIENHVKDIITVDDQEIMSALRLVWERLKIVIEPSAAVPVAAVLKNPELFAQKRVGLIVSGGNVDLQSLSSLPFP